MAVMQRPGQSTWTAVVTYTDALGKRRQKWSGGHRTKTEAKDAHDELKVALRAGTVRTDSRMSLADWFDQWLPTMDLRPSTSSTWRTVIDAYLKPVLGDVRLADID